MEYGLIAERLGHSFSKEIHSKLADYDYELKEIAPEDLAAFMLAKEFKAINVTIPYKADVIPYLDEIDATAKEIGAVNTIVNKNGKLFGFNTDFAGMKAMILKSGIDIKNKKVLILGSGGTSKTAFAVAKNLGAKEILRISRKAQNGMISYTQAHENHSDAEILINTTPCGMYPNITGCAVDVSYFENLEGVIDAVYNPLITDFALSAKKQGAKAVCGLYMLVAQAVFACEKFLDTKFDSAVIDKIYLDILKSKQNIVLIGMPSCGKSTIGKSISERTSRPFYDTDCLIEEKTGKHPSVIIEEQGENAFRDIESQVIKEVSAKSGSVIATGGGAILREENRDNLHKNGVLWFVDRPLENLITTCDRPLSSNRELLKKRYDERYTIYMSAANYVLKGEMSIQEATEKIIKDFGL